MTAQKLVINI